MFKYVKVGMPPSPALNFVFDPLECASGKSQVVGLDFDETFGVYICICKESRNYRKSNDKKGGTSRKSKTHFSL